MKKAALFLCLLVMAACKQDVLKTTTTGTSTVARSPLTSPPDYATVTITNVNSGKFLEVAGNPTANEKFKDNTLLQQWQLSGSVSAQDNWQKWHLIYQTTAGGVRYYQIRNLFSGKLIDVPSGTNVSGTVLQQYASFPLPADQQLWKLQDLGGGQYNIVNKGNGLALSVSGGSTANGAQVIQETAASGNKQRWSIDVIAEDTWRDDAVVRFFFRNSTSQGSAAFDEGTSIPLTWSGNNGKVLWITQDAWDGSQLQSNSMFNCNDVFRYNNSVLIQPSHTDWSPGNTPNMTINNSNNGRPLQVFNNQPGTDWSWPGPGVEIGDKVYVQCGEGTSLTASNQSLYRLTQSTGTQWVAERFQPNGFSGQTTVSYSSGMVKPGDGYVYAFGSEGVGYGYNSYVHVARFAESSPFVWQYWSGSAWISTVTTGAASKVADGLGTNAIAYVNGKYVQVTMDQGFNCDASRNIYMATATSPTGPFSTPVKVYAIQEYFKGQYARYYTPAIHPEFASGHNELLVTYCLNFSACGQASCDGSYLDPYFYRVKGIRVPYSKIGL
ncbi:hypothetical protein DCC81_04110 [Chitinophaga parva]|uniref:Ricin B lectin domain-containing protein n=1 Tax=Chitinophaga parva TaxID=2169414 RepID=A0A2T7BLW9_9BACT|nr:RICIN domain-containing protein [Chitinophaga parva]PUZ28677.1 hypothetical protein DCC81_04110 [Chitinophaga parva]